MPRTTAARITGVVLAHLILYRESRYRGTTAVHRRIRAPSAKAAKMSSPEEILVGYDDLRAGQEAFYKDLHEHPELSHQEHRTAQRVAGKLQDYGFAVRAGIGGTGVVGVLANGSGPTVLLRAELDALPVREDTGADYASTATGRDAAGHEVPVAHACGHDMHMSCLLGMAKLMADHRGKWTGTLIPLFQPAEETGDGAQGMVDDGLFKRIPAPDVALTQHVLPGIAGTVSTRSGPFMATEDSIDVTVYGKGGHGAMPQHTIDPVVLASSGCRPSCPVRPRLGRSQW
jgi:amidohydrolase